MTRDEFQRLPYLLTQQQVMACGYAPATVAKYAEHGILAAVLPPGTTQRRFQKVQLAALLNWPDLVATEAWRREKPLLGLGAVLQWTGYAKMTIAAIVAAGGLTAVQPGGIGERKFRKAEIGKWIGM